MLPTVARTKLRLVRGDSGFTHGFFSLSDKQIQELSAKKQKNPDSEILRVMPTDPFSPAEKMLVFIGSGDVFEQYGLKVNTEAETFCDAKFPKMRATRRPTIGIESHGMFVGADRSPTLQIAANTVTACDPVLLPTCEFISQEDGYYIFYIIPKSRMCAWKEYEKHLDQIVSATVRRGK
ncbi:MAG TPA: hypothetical protein VG735_00215 [Caulobacterales bacterium]|nr:hypothetical protein [Caulobacterales bacterium]